MKPIVKDIMPILLFLSFDSGTSSSTITYIIAPPARANRYGIRLFILIVIMLVILANNGSTSPDIKPYFMAFFLFFVFNSPTTIPSGILWSVIASDSVKALFRDIMFVREPANPTPVAIPSGILWRMIAIMIIRFEFLLFLFIFKSSDSIMNIPSNIPNTGGNQFLLISIDGFIRERKDATNITPAEKPKASFINFWFSFFIKYILSVPIMTY